MFGSKRERREPAGLGPWPSVFSLAAVRHCDQKQLAEGRTCSPPSQSIIGRNRDKNSRRAGMWDRGHGRTLLTGLLSLTQPRATCCGAVPPTAGWVCPPNHQSEDPTGFPIGQPDAGIFSVEAPSSPMTLTCVKLTKPKPSLKDLHSEGVLDRGAG